MRRPPVPLAAGLEIALKLTKAVAALHRAGIIHRDIKPENIMLETDGGLKLIDLGVARLRQFDEGESLEVPGTRSYMAPELFTGTPADESSDIFALGVTIYRMFTGGAYPYGEVEAFAQPRLGKATPLGSCGPTCRPGSIAPSRAPSPRSPRAICGRHRVRVRARTRLAARRAARLRTAVAL